MSETSSLDLKAEETYAFTNRPTQGTFSKIKTRLSDIKKEWGPGLAAKEYWDDEYNFPAGRYAGQAADKAESNPFVESVQTLSRRAMAYFKRDDASLFYITDGAETSPILLLLHGWTCDLHDWNLQVNYFRQLGFRTVAVDHRGHGRSSIPDTSAPLSPEALADDAAALLEHLGAKSAVVAGHSLGTVVASALAIRHPEKVTALILSDPVYNAPIERASSTLQSLSGPDAPAVAAESFARAFYTPHTPGWMIDWHKRRALGVPASVVFGTLYELIGREGCIGVGKNAREYLKKRQAPRLVICGWEHSATLDRELPPTEKDKIVVIPESSHWPHQQEASKFNTIAGEWLLGLGLVPERGVAGENFILSDGHSNTK